MQYNIILIRTRKGSKYARKILNSVKWINNHKYKAHFFNCVSLTIEQFVDKFEANEFEKYNPKNTIFHARCANPRTQWTEYLRVLQDNGYKVVNSVDAIELTSDKLACSLHLQDKVAHPKSWKYTRKMDKVAFINLVNEIDKGLKNPSEIIAKPYTSLEQGANVRKVTINGDDDLFGIEYDVIRAEIDKVPGNNIVLQELIPYTALHRVIVIGGVALPYTFIDRVEFHKEGDWKVSCCLNKTTMQLCENPPLRLLQLAEQTQKEVGGVINFIDIFEYPWKKGENGIRDMHGNFTNAEINTACSLNIHEDLAKKAGRPDWNIHYRIARQLVKELLNV